MDSMSYECNPRVAKPGCVREKFFPEVPTFLHSIALCPPLYFALGPTVHTRVHTR